jgi:hypothetical protein
MPWPKACDRAVVQGHYCDDCDCETALSILSLKVYSAKITASSDFFTLREKYLTARLEAGRSVTRVQPPPAAANSGSFTRVSGSKRFPFFDMNRGSSAVSVELWGSRNRQSEHWRSVGSTARKTVDFTVEAG